MPGAGLGSGGERLHTGQVRYGRGARCHARKWWEENQQIGQKGFVAERGERHAPCCTGTCEANGFGRPHTSHTCCTRPELSSFSTHVNTLTLLPSRHRDVMLKALESGKTLVVDRYSFSGMAYSLAKRLPGVDQQV